FARSDDGRDHQENDDKNPAHGKAYPPQAPNFKIQSEGTPIVSDFIGSAVVSTAAVGVPPRESSAQDSDSKNSRMSFGFVSQSFGFCVPSFSISAVR